jgi:hypothetical protein
MKEDVKKNLLEIVDLVEDKQFPARRNITDYIVCLLHCLKVDSNLTKEIENTFEEEYKKRDSR